MGYGQSERLCVGLFQKWYGGEVVEDNCDIKDDTLKNVQAAGVDGITRTKRVMKVTSLIMKLSV